MADKIIPYKADDIEWEEPAQHVTDGYRAELLDLARMANALKQRTGSWAILSEYPTTGRASVVAGQLRKKFPSYEFAGRKALTGGSRLYVRVP